MSLKNYPEEKTQAQIIGLWSCFYIFRDIMIDDLIEMVEESHRLGQVSGVVNGTFITLIPIGKTQETKHKIHT